MSGAISLLPHTLSRDYFILSLYLYGNVTGNEPLDSVECGGDFLTRWGTLLGRTLLRVVS
jgi:hypothetical protein